jgi:hypothetical protein
MKSSAKSFSKGEDYQIKEAKSNLFVGLKKWIGA